VVALEQDWLYAEREREVEQLPNEFEEEEFLVLEAAKMTCFLHHQCLTADEDRLDLPVLEQLRFGLGNSIGKNVA
jgi:hypothetical protein